MRRLYMPFIAVALAATAHAQDRPALVELRLFGEPATKAGPGNSVEIVGRDLHRCPPPAWQAPGTPPPAPCDHREVVVTVGGRVMAKQSVEPTAILFALHDVPPGQHRVEVEVGGRSLGSLKLEVLREPVPGPDDGAVDVRDEVLARFTITRFELVTDVAGVSFLVEGQARGVPDGASMTVTLAYEKRALEGQLAPVAGGAFRASFGPFTRALPLGTWSAVTLFELKKQPRRLLRGWTPTKVEAEVLERVERTALHVEGTPDAIAAQREALRAHYRSVADATERLLDDVLAAYASGCRVLFRDAARNTFSAADHAAHVQQVGAARTPQDLARLQADLRFATASGHLKADEYQAWAEQTLLPAWLGSYGVNRDYREATIVPIDPRAARLAEDLHAIVFGTLRGHAEALFAAARLGVPASLVTPPGGVRLPPLEGTGQGRRAYERGRDELVSRLQGP